MDKSKFNMRAMIKSSQANGSTPVSYSPFTANKANQGNKGEQFSIGSSSKITVVAGIASKDVKI